MPPGASAAAALLCGLDRLPDPVSGSEAPYCMMGICFDCLAEIDGMPEPQAASVTARPGMRIRRHQGPHSIDLDDVPPGSPSFPIPEPRSGGA